MLGRLYPFTDLEILQAMGRQIRTARTERGWSRKNLAEHARISEHTVRNAEEGRDITMSTALRLWRALGLLDRVGLPADVPPPRERRIGQPSPVSPLALWREQRRQARRKAE